MNLLCDLLVYLDSHEQSCFCNGLFINLMIFMYINKYLYECYTYQIFIHLFNGMKINFILGFVEAVTKMIKATHRPNPVARGCPIASKIRVRVYDRKVKNDPQFNFFSMGIF